MISEASLHINTHVQVIQRVTSDRSEAMGLYYWDNLHCNSLGLSSSSGVLEDNSRPFFDFLALTTINRVYLHDKMPVLPSLEPGSADWIPCKLGGSESSLDAKPGGIKTSDLVVPFLKPAHRDITCATVIPFSSAPVSWYRF